MHHESYTVIGIIVDLFKTFLGVTLINVIGDITLPGLLHEWISCAVGLLGCYHILRKIYQENKYYKNKKD